ncbi:hypothetical protein F4813DRAFT_356994 [Daldinia decipiens]|uniref:uncharacterized protein n=1 Tax=Daldinia decipiens TaxID=326647 RepID=UPI0020C3F442|nr:uncharacterized protein F4813DRAFT_356994 [Daldinia decipiens]KAI1658504.1 hypothetical protein F4813DRAFT_356994 [Daldinia decipiens]
MFTICSKLMLNTGPLTAYNAILEFKSYPQWDSFIIDIALPDIVTSTPDDIYVLRECRSDREEYLRIISNYLPTIKLVTIFRYLL